MDFSVTALKAYSTALAVHFLLYGAYAILFGLCVTILASRKDHQQHFVLSVMLAVLFLLATISLVVDTKYTFDIFAGSSGVEVIEQYTVSRTILVFLTNVIANFIMLWRCYIIWERRVRVIIVPGVLSLTNHVLAIVLLTRFHGGTNLTVHHNSVGFQTAAHDTSAAVLSCVFLVWTAFTSSLLTLMLGGRIFWIGRQLSVILGPEIRSKYCPVVAAIIESGVVYPFALVLYAASMLATLNFSPDDQGTFITAWSIISLVFQTTLNQFAGIAQTLIIVRIGLGRSFQSVDDVISTLRWRVVLNMGMSHQERINQDRQTLWILRRTSTVRPVVRNVAPVRVQYLLACL